MKGKGNDSHFEINLLKFCFDILDQTEILPDVRYQTSLILAALANEEVNSFLTKFLTKMSVKEFTKLCFMAQFDIQKTEEFLKANINTKGINDLLRDFLVPKNNEVLLFY